MFQFYFARKSGSESTTSTVYFVKTNTTKRTEYMKLFSFTFINNTEASKGPEIKFGFKKNLPKLRLYLHKITSQNKAENSYTEINIEKSIRAKSHFFSQDNEKYPANIFNFEVDTTTANNCPKVFRLKNGKTVTSTPNRPFFKKNLDWKTESLVPFFKVFLNPKCLIEKGNLEIFHKVLSDLVVSDIDGNPIETSKFSDLIDEDKTKWIRLIFYKSNTDAQAIGSISHHNFILFEGLTASETFQVAIETEFQINADEDPLLEELFLSNKCGLIAEFIPDIAYCDAKFEDDNIGYRDILISSI